MDSQKLSYDTPLYQLHNCKSDEEKGREEQFIICESFKLHLEKRNDFLR
jgi:hypothetical protein